MRPLAQDSEHPNPPRNRRGQPSLYSHEKIKEACALAFMGATDAEMGEYFGVHEDTIKLWQFRHPEFREACMTFGDEADARVERSLYKRAVAGEFKAQAYWLTNRRRKTYGGAQFNAQGDIVPPTGDTSSLTDRALALAVLHMLDGSARVGDREGPMIEGEVEDVD